MSKKDGVKSITVWQARLLRSLKANQRTKPFFGMDLFALEGLPGVFRRVRASNVLKKPEGNEIAYYEGTNFEVSRDTDLEAELATCCLISGTESDQKAAIALSNHRTAAPEPKEPEAADATPTPAVETTDQSEEQLRMF